jgi:hypothetical protein
MDENRRAPRRHVLKAGLISIGSGTITCTVRNISRSGASIDAASPNDIPDEFRLVLEMETRPHLCTVVWRKEKQIGVTFIHEHYP